jgi:pimeloyl-ACP methyl ester carboxylesterase
VSGERRLRGPLGAYAQGVDPASDASHAADAARRDPARIPEGAPCGGRLDMTEAPRPGGFDGGKSTGTVRSSDGTTIGYCRRGTGPGLVLLHGAGQSSENLSTLATILSDRFTVYLPDRRGRGMSGPYGDFHGLRTEVGDLCALLDECGAHFVFGLSAGAVIAVETALVRPTITKLALYEPPLSFDGVVHSEWAPRFERELRAGRLGSALVEVLKGTSDRTLLAHLPSPLLGIPLNFVLQKRKKVQPHPGGMSIEDIVRTVQHDVQTVRDAAGPLLRFARLTCDVLLLGGSKSASRFAATLDGLSAVLPASKRVVLHAVGHTAADNTKRPDRVADALGAFFSQ